MREVEEDGDEGVQGGLEDEDEEDVTEEDLIPDLSGVQVEVVDSTHEGTLIVYRVHICHKQREWPGEVKWRCACCCIPQVTSWRWQCGQIGPGNFHQSFR